MATHQPFTDTDRQALREGHAAGKSLTAIAAELGRAKSTVGKHAKAMGLSWDTTATANAADARADHNRKRRAELETRLLDEASQLLDQLHKPHTAFNFGGKDNTYAEHTLDEPDIAGKRSLIQAASTAIDRAVKLAEVDRDTTGARAGQSMIGGLFALLHSTVPDDPDETTEE